MNKEKKLLKILNTMLKCCKPLYYKDFNKFSDVKSKKYWKKLEDAESLYPELGIATFINQLDKGNREIEFKYDDNRIGISTLSIIATITDVLIGKRLACNIETKGKRKGQIIGFKFLD